MNVADWLRTLGLGQYEAAFRENSVGMDVLPKLTADDLKDLGVNAVGDRRRLLDAIAALRASAERVGTQNTEEPPAERRQLSVMFCDISGSTALSNRLDPEDLSAVVRAYQSAVRSTISRFGGFIARYVGDGVLIYFGWPEAHETDAENAVRAALAVIAAVNESPIHGERLSIRIGIATGLVVVGSPIGEGDARQQTAIGETPNLAARLQSLAEPNAVVIAAGTRRLVGDLFECRDLGTLEMKGIAAPVPAWQVLRPSTIESRFEALHGSTLGRLVGRDEEIDLLLRRWARAKAGDGQVVLISGEPGIGKSRIAEELLARLEHEPHVRLRYFCSPHHTHSALHPFIAQLQQAAGFEPDSNPQARLDKLEALLAPTVQNLPQDLVLIAELLSVPIDARYPPLAVSPQQRRELTLKALVDRLHGISQQKPSLILVEDAHWIDPTSLDLLDRIVTRVADLPILLVITLRPDLQSSWIGQPHVTLLALSRIGRRVGADIISGLTEGKALPDVVVEQILSRADGVPLFIEELTHTLLESGLLRALPDHYELDGPLPPLAVPMTLQDSLVARLDRLASVKDVVQTGATIGREFSYELIAAVATLPPADLAAALERLTTSGLISQRGTPPDATYTFKHTLVQDAAYGTLLRGRRQQLHAKIAKLLTERFRATADDLPEVVAHHFTEAGLASDAIGYWRRAGQRASGRWANREAADSFERALSVLEELPKSSANLEQSFEIRLELRTVLNLLGEVGQMLGRLREAETIAVQLKDERRRCQVCALMTNVHCNLGEFDAAVASGTRALDIAGRLDDLQLRILSTSYLVQVHSHRTDYRRVVDLATENLAVLPPEWVDKHFGRPAPVSIFDLFYLIISLAELGRFTEAAQHEAKAVRLVEPLQHAFNSLGLAYYAAGTTQILKGDWAVAQTLIERVISVLRSGKIVIMLPHAVAAYSWVLAQIGAASEALNHFREGEQLVERNVASGIVGQCGGTYRMLGRTGLLLGLLDEAQRLGERAVQCSGNQPGIVAQAMHLLGDIEAHRHPLGGEHGETHYHDALMLAEPRGMRPLVAHCHLGLGKLYTRTGRHDDARAHLATAATMYRQMEMGFWLKQADDQLHQMI
jgi:class 3 adenylate cyclase/tetratricopeptide (TPR) repeat protein